MKNPAHEKLRAFVVAYLEAAVWSSTLHDGEPMDQAYNIRDIAPIALRQAIRECIEFRRECPTLLAHAGSDDRNGVDFWLTRNRHGAGFWDRGYGDVGLKLTDAAHLQGSRDLYVGDDGMLYFS